MSVWARATSNSSHVRHDGGVSLLCRALQTDQRQVRPAHPYSDVSGELKHLAQGGEKPDSRRSPSPAAEVAAPASEINSGSAFITVSNPAEW